jgi:hypothetical protein|tara:strand:+ start:2972 stop:3466 length:495 start_codon:yes stop_codon:yes gene_type:complete
MILRILIASFLVAIISTVNAEARNEYLNDGTNTCDQGSWEAYTEVRQNEYKSGSSAESQNQVLGWRFRKSIGDVCDEEFVKDQRKKQKLKIQLELVKECKRVPRISPPPVEFAELINACTKLGVMSSSSFNERDFDPKVSYWTELKEKYMKENPDIITLDNYKK